MYYAIYENKQMRERDSLEDIFSLPGKYKVYSIVNGKIQVLSDINTPKPLVINDFEITKLNRHLLKSDLEIYDRLTERFYDLITVGGDLQKVLLSITNELNFAREFPNFDTYLKHSELNRRVDALEKENAKLKQMIQALQRSKS